MIDWQPFINNMMKVFKFIIVIFGELFFFISLVLIALMVFIAVGVLNPYALFAIFLFLFLTVSYVRNYWWRHWIGSHKQDLRVLMVEGISFVILVQLLFVTLVPLQSIIPYKFQNWLGISTFVDVSTCDYEKYFTAASAIWKDQINFDNVHIIVGGEMRSLERLAMWGIISENNNIIRGAMTFGTNIYISKAEECLERTTFIHEMTHVWQFQQQPSLFFGIDKIYYWVDQLRTQITNPDVLYEYGGYYGLKEASEQGKQFLDFGIEQQAVIVQHYDQLNSGFVVNGDTALTIEYQSLLNEYIDQMLTNGVAIGQL